MNGDINVKTLCQNDLTFQVVFFILQKTAVATVLVYLFFIYFLVSFLVNHFHFLCHHHHGLESHNDDVNIF